MATLIDEAMEYEPSHTKNIAELNRIPTNTEVLVKDFKDSEGKPFSIRVIVVDGEDYRVPVSVLRDLKSILEEKPDLKFFKVKKAGSGMSTSYTVIPLE